MRPPFLLGLVVSLFLLLVRAPCVFSVLPWCAVGRLSAKPDSLVAYYLGPERDWIRIDSEELIIRFDATGRAADAHIARD